MNQRELSKEKSIQIITATALKLFSSNGFKNTSVRQIALKAGISPGLMYNYFKNKEDLLKQIFMQGMADVAASFADKPTSATKTAFELHIRKTFEILDRNREFWRLLHILRMQKSVTKKLSKDISAMQAYILEQLKQNLKELGIKSAEAEALLLFATIDGIAAHYLMDENYPLQPVLKNLIKKYIP
jgi:AcrR family transcriptional regulator